MAASIQNWAAQERIQHDTAVKTLVDFAAQFQEQVAYRRALAGDYDAVLDVPDAMRRVYVQLGGAGGEIAQAEYDQYKPKVGEGVFLRRTRVMSGGGWWVLGKASGDALPCV